MQCLLDIRSASTTLNERLYEQLYVKFVSHFHFVGYAPYSLLQKLRNTMCNCSLYVLYNRTSLISVIFRLYSNYNRNSDSSRVASNSSLTKYTIAWFKWMMTKTWFKSHLTRPYSQLFSVSHETVFPTCWGANSLYNWSSSNKSLLLMFRSSCLLDQNNYELQITLPW